MNKTVWTHIGRGLLIVAAIGISAALVAAQDTGMGTEQEEANRAVIIQLADAITAGDFATVAQWTTGDFIIHSPLGDLDGEAFGSFIVAMQASISDFSLVRDEIIAEGNATASRSTISGVFDGAEFASPLGVGQPTGQPVTLVIQTFDHFNDDGLVTEEWVMFDLLGFFAQMGVLPAPTS